MKTHKLAGLFLVLSLILGGLAGGASAKAVGSSSPSYITQEVGHQLSQLPWYGVFDDLQYQVNGTQVILSGEVTTDHEQTKYDAEKAVKKISGVTQVVDNIRVLPYSTLDNRIRRDEFRTIFSQSDLGRYTEGSIPQIHIVVDNGHVTLEGQVINQMDRSRHCGE